MIPTTESHQNSRALSLNLGAKIHQWDNPGKPETQFRIHLVLKAKKVKFKNPHHRFTIENNKAHGKFLNVYGASYDNGGKIIVRGANSRCKMHVL